MRNVLIILLIITQVSSCQKNNTVRMPIPHANTPAMVSGDTSKKTFSYLALGDSYTIGHNVPEQDNYPNQTISLLKTDNLYGEVKIIATTGWTTANLKSGIKDSEVNGTLLHQYDIVTLLIGVNNEYQGAPIEIYKTEFEELLKKSITLAGGNASHVIVLSIPDWSVTPFASGRDRNKIAGEIDVYNAINKDFSEKYAVNYIDITPWTRQAATDLSLLAADQLHPSGKEYARWAASLEAVIKKVLKS